MIFPIIILPVILHFYKSSILSFKYLNEKSIDSKFFSLHLSISNTLINYIILQL
jgi:hypothetical protein